MLPAVFAVVKAPVMLILPVPLVTRLMLASACTVDIVVLAMVKLPILALVTATTAGVPPGVLPSLTRKPATGSYQIRPCCPT